MISNPKGDNIDSILARLDDRLRKFSGTEEPGKEGAEEKGTKKENGNHDWSSEGAKSPEANSENLFNKPPVAPAREIGEAREHLIPEDGANWESKPTNGSHQNGNSERIVSVESGGEEEGSHQSEPDTDSEPPKSPDLPSPPSPLERPNRAPSASSFRSKK